MVRVLRSDRGLRAEQIHMGFPWETGRAYRLHANSPVAGNRRPKPRRFGVPVATPDEETRQQRKVVSVPRETEGIEKGEGSLIILIVPFERWETDSAGAAK